MSSTGLTSQPTMRSAILLMVFCLLGSSAQRFILAPVIIEAPGAPVRPPWCGPCPPVSCLNVPAVPLGYCCGCRLPIDNAPITCPANINCPPPSQRLCRDYNYLMDCCCGYVQ